jgi:hypothetical protein
VPGIILCTPQALNHCDLEFMVIVVITATTTTTITTEGVQDILLQNMPIWHIDFSF